MLMDNFRQIVTLLDGYKLRNIDVLGNDDSNSRFTEFYRLIKNETITTDEQAAIHFYGENAKPTDIKYRVFKSDFKDRLLNTLLFIDPNNVVDEYGRIVYQSTREWTAIEILFKKTLSYAAIPLAERLLTTCLKYEITDLTVKILERLKGVYATLIGDKKKYQDYKEKFWHYKIILDAEYLAKEAFQEIRIEYVNSTAYRPENVTKAQALYDNLRPYLERYNSCQLHHFAFLVENFMYQIVNDYQGTLETNEKAIQFMNQKPFGLENVISIYQNQKIIALLMLRRYDMCKIALEEGLKMQSVGSFNWFATMQSKMILAFHTETYNDGYDTYLEVRSTKQFKDLQGHSSEMWIIFKAYLYLSISLGKIKKVDESALGTFRLKKFLNEIPVSSGDKKGMGIAVLVAQIALMITEKMYDELIDKVEAIEKYLVRHVSKSNVAGYRANQFVKVLLEIPKAGFNRIILERRTRSLIEDIASVPYNIVEAGYKVEIIPYETLWRELLPFFSIKTLDANKIKKKS
jgi:hypothetical protein